MAGSDSGGNDLLLVTGASGFVGSAIAIAARTAGYRVRVLVRRSSPRINIQPDDEVVVGDMCDRASLVPALKGVRYLAHAAADYRLWAPPTDDIMRTNLEGTRSVMEEALRAAVTDVVKRQRDTGMFDVLPLPYEFGLNAAATAPYQIIGLDRPGGSAATGKCVAQMFI